MHSVNQTTHYVQIHTCRCTYGCTFPGGPLSPCSPLSPGGPMGPAIPWKKVTERDNKTERKWLSGQEQKEAKKTWKRGRIPWNYCTYIFVNVKGIWSLTCFPGNPGRPSFPGIPSLPGTPGLPPSPCLCHYVKITLLLKQVSKLRISLSLITKTSILEKQIKYISVYVCECMNPAHKVME